MKIEIDESQATVQFKIKISLVLNDITYSTENALLYFKNFIQGQFFVDLQGRKFGDDKAIQYKTTFGLLQFN